MQRLDQTIPVGFLSEEPLEHWNKYWKKNLCSHIFTAKTMSNIMEQLWNRSICQSDPKFWNLESGEIINDWDRVPLTDLSGDVIRLLRIE